MLHTKEDLTDSHKSKLRALLDRFPELRETYELKEEFRGIYKAQDIEEAREFYNDWCSKVPLYSEFRQVIKTVDNWDKEIFNYFQYSYTNGVTEALNRVIKDVDRKGHGYTFDVLRAKMLYAPVKEKIAYIQKKNLTVAETIHTHFVAPSLGEDYYNIANINKVAELFI